MSIDTVELGGKIRRYREQLQLLPADVCEQAGISPERLAGIEVGTFVPSGDEILILSDVFRCDFRFFISNEKLAPFEETRTLYRKYGGDFSKADRLAVQEFLYLCESEAYLEAEAGSEAARCPSFVPRGTLYTRHGEDAAAFVRGHLQYSPRECRANTFDEFRRLGFHVFRRKLANSNISGLCIRHHEIGPCILINYSEDWYRQRFSCAHEAGHAVIDTGVDDQVVVTLSRTSGLRETRANRFASCFLLPPPLLQALPDPASW